MIKYTDYNDYELVYLAQENNEDAIEILTQKYKNIIISKCQKIYPYLKNKGIELVDLIQECNLGFINSIKKFNQNDNVTFYTFTNICMNRQLQTEISRLNRNKYKVLNESISIESLDDEDDKSILDYIPANINTPELDLISIEDYYSVYSKIISNLTKTEKEVLDLRIEGYTYKEISQNLQISPKSVDNTIQRIKNKINKSM